MSRRKNHHTTDSSDDEVPLKKLKCMSDTRRSSFDSDSDMNITCWWKNAHSNSYDALYGYSMEKCEFCNNIFHNKYDLIVHNAKHLFIPIMRQPLHKCLNCFDHFASLKQLHHHFITVHVGNVPDLLTSIVKHNHVVKWDELSRFQGNNISSDEEPLSPVFVIKKRIKAKVNKKDVMENVVEKTTTVRRDDSVADFKTRYDENINKTDSNFIKNDILRSIVEKMPVIRCDDQVTELFKAKNEKNAVENEKNINIYDERTTHNDNILLQSIVEKMPVIRCDDQVTELFKAKNEKNVVKNEKNINIYDERPLHNDNILQSIVEKMPVIRCDDSVTELIKARNDKNVVKQGKRAINKDILERIVEKMPVIRCDDSVTELIKANSNRNAFNNDTNALKNDKRANNNILESIAQKMAVIRCDDSVTELIKAKNEFVKSSNDKKMRHFKNKTLESTIENTHAVQGDSSEMELAHSLNTNFKGIKSEFDIIFDEDSSEFTNNEDMELFNESTSNFKSRIIFEDDSDCDDDLFTYNKSNLQCPVSSMISIDGEKKPGKRKYVKNNKILLGSKTAKSTASIHYEDLIKPGLYFCKHCRLSFPNRYETYIHEICHFKIRQRRPQTCHYCDRYIAGNYKTLDKHIEREHGDTHKKKQNHKTCNVCGLNYYNYAKHTDLYHYHYAYNCGSCGMRFRNESDKIDHEKRSEIEGSCEKLLVGDERQVSKVCSNGWKNVEKPKMSGGAEDYNEYKLVKICEVCSMFLKCNHKLKYVEVGEYSMVGEHQQCERCNKEYFEVKVFKALRKRPEKKERRKPGDSNKHRLKAIQQRLKKLNKLTRYYLDLFYFRSDITAIQNDERS